MTRARSILVLPLALLAAQGAIPPRLGAQQPTLGAVVQGLRFRSIGPAVTGGRVHDVEALPGDASTIYVASATGGLWRSTNKGTTWTPIFDDQRVSSFGAVAIAPSNPRIIWVGTGEQENRQSSSWGDGVYRSTDGGDHWLHLGLDSTRQIARIVVHPANPEVAWVAAVGNLWRASPERGVYKTTDGGRSWRRVLYVDTLTGATDLVIDPRDPNTLYAATYQRLRSAWGFNGGGPGSGLWKSTDGGATWRPLTAGVPAGDKGRIGLAIAPTAPNVLYALVEHATESGTYRSADGGETWTRVSRTNPRPMYYSAIYVDPTNENRVWVLSDGLSLSEDGGRSFRQLPVAPTYDVGLKSDHHTMWIDPHDTRHFYLGGDGGLHESWDMGHTFTRINNFPIGQFYKVAVDMRTPYWIYGGLQDNHSWMGPSATRHWNGIVNEDWRQIGFGDGMFQAVDVSGAARAPGDAPTAAPRFVYSESQDGEITRVDANTGDIMAIKPRAPRGEKPYRFDWTSPFLVSSHPPGAGAPATLYLGGNRLFISHDGGSSWRRTPDLTRHVDRDSLRLMGVLGRDITLSKNDGESSFGEITTIAESPVDARVLWVGTDDGNLQLSRDGGDTWTNVVMNVPGLPRGTESSVGPFLSRVTASSAAPGMAFAAFDAHRDGDFAPHVYRTSDFGRTWLPIVSGLPADGTARVIAEYPGAPGVLLLGTEHALFISSDTGRTWTRWTSNLPTTRFDDIVVHPREKDIVLGTHGRGIWVLDDARVLAAWNADVARERVHLFPVRPATLLQYWKDFSFRGQAAYAGENPPEGALLTYWLAGSDTAARITITDARGRLVRTLQVPATAGTLQRVNWDLRHEPPPATHEGEADARPTLPPLPHDIGPRGPLVSPGTYTATLEAQGARSTQRVLVRGDPLMPQLTAAEQRGREDFLLRLLAMQRQVRDLAARVAKLRGGLVARRDSLGPTAESTVREDYRIRIDSVTALEQRIATGRAPVRALRTEIDDLANALNGGGARPGTLHGPTRTQRDLLTELQAALQRANGEVERQEGGR
ncbi:MAG TPA: hypothetical protein VJU87_00400 [Gemmatimonadaceae bacterium]|nr:hypothetical protein [Gemmatimonadaceae bacterium]